MEIPDEHLRNWILRRVPRDLQKQLHLPEEVDAFQLLDNLLVQVHHAFNALMRQPRSEYSKEAQRWAGCFVRLAKTYYLLRDLMAQEAPLEMFDLCLELEIAQGLSEELSEWLVNQRLRSAA